MDVPIKLAAATWRIEDVCPSYSPPNLSTRSSFACPSPIWISDLQPPLCAEYYSSPATRRNPRLRASRLLHRQRLSSLLFLARGARCHGASDSGGLDRLKLCVGCYWLFLDASRNRSRRWCTLEVCGTHEKARRYVAKRAAKRNSKRD